jgi:hypothetical protein
MKLRTIFFLVMISALSHGQIKTLDFPDTLWVYGTAISNDYGLTPQTPIKVGGATLPKHIYRYLNNLTDAANKKIEYERIGSYGSADIGRSKPLTAFKIHNSDKEVITIYFDQYSWDYPKVIRGLNWQEKRSGYHGELKNDTIFHGNGIYFFEDGGFYKGSWKDGIMSGNGIMNIPGQEIYTGYFSNGEYDGFGTLEYADGGKYVGTWKGGNRHGKGIIYYPPQSEIQSIEGEFQNGKPTGIFKVNKADGSVETTTFN